MLVAAAVLAGCGSSVSVDTEGKVAIDHKTLSVAEVPFTFEYPTDYQEATDESLASVNALAVVGSEPQSYIAVRRNSRTAMSLDALERQARRALGESVLGDVRETHSDIPMVAITVEDTGGEAVGLRSTIYGFSLAGSSWLIECHSTESEREALSDACRHALDSIEQTS